MKNYYNQMMKDCAETKKICEKEKVPQNIADEISNTLRNIYNNDRKYYTHNLSYETHFLIEGESVNEDHIPWLNLAADKTPFLSFEENIDWGCYGWMEEIHSDEIIQVLKSLSEKDLELLTLLSYCNLTQTEIAQKWQVSDASVSKRLKKIRNIFSKRLKNIPL